MTPVLRRAMPVLTAALTLASMACESRPSERTPTDPSGRTPTASRSPGSDEGQARAMAVAPPLGAADPFAVLGASTVTNVISAGTLLTGNLGVSPGTAVTGFPPGIFTGTLHLNDATAITAQTDIVTAYNALAGQPCDVNMTGIDLGGLTLIPGAYCFSSSAQLTGTLTLDGLGNPLSVWVFQIGSTLTTASGSRVVYINGGQACATFWQVGSSATLGTTTDFAGNILALGSITLNTDANNVGALFARTGAVTLDSNLVSRVGSCGGGPQPTPTPLPTPTPGPVPALPQGAEWILLVVLLGIGAYVLSRH